MLTMVSICTHSGMCVGAHHEMLSGVQRRNPTTDITGIADDTYYWDDGGRVYTTFDDKRNAALRETSLVSKLPKVRAYSPLGDMRRTPADIPGSALHPDGVVRGITAGGVPVSCDERWQAEQVEALLETRLRNQRLVDRIGTTGKCRNASQLRFNLTRICASAIPNHWMRNLPPSLTSAAAEFADTLISRSFLAMLRSDLSPDARVALVALAARLPIALGGFGLANYHATRHAAYTASFLATWPIIARAIPTLAAAHPPSSPFFAHLSTAYAHLQSTLATVRTRFAALDSVTYHDVFGDRQHAFHPPLKETLDMPDFNTLTLDTVSKITKSLR